MRELHGQWIIEPKLAPQSRDGLGVGAFADHLLHRISRRDVQQEEHHDQHTGQRRDREQQPAEEKGEHRGA